MHWNVCKPVEKNTRNLRFIIITVISYGANGSPQMRCAGTWAFMNTVEGGSF